MRKLLSADRLFKHIRKWYRSGFIIKLHLAIFALKLICYDRTTIDTCYQR